MCLILTAASYHRRLGCAVPVDIVAGLPAESPGSSQWVVGIDQSSRGYSECRACDATSMHRRLLPVLRGRVQLYIRAFGTVSTGGFAPALVVLTTRAFQRVFFLFGRNVRTPVLSSGPVPTAGNTSHCAIGPKILLIFMWWDEDPLSTSQTTRVELARDCLQG